MVTFCNLTSPRSWIPFEIVKGGYLLHSPDPYRLWFGLDLSFGVKNLIHGTRLDGQRLLHEAEEELAAAS